MNEHAHHAAEPDTRHTTPAGPLRPGERQRPDELLRYLGAVAATSGEPGDGHPAGNGPAGARPHPVDRPRAAHASGPQGPQTPVGQVGDVMEGPSVSVRRDTPFLDIARTLSREHLSGVPVVDAHDRVIGMVSESDLLAKAAADATAHHPGPIGWLRALRLYEKARGETAAALMTSPAISVHPRTPLADAAWLAARSRIKRLPVIDDRGRLVGVVRRNAILHALVREDDAERHDRQESRPAEE